MSTIPKEEIEKIAFEAATKLYGEQIPIGYQKFFTDGYQLATDGREELEKKISELKLALCGYDNMIIDFTKEVERLQSQCTEKEKQLLSADAQNLQQSESLQVLHQKINEKEKECEELKDQIKGKDRYIDGLLFLSNGYAKQIEELKAENERLKEQYGIMDVRRRNAIKSLEESEKQFGEQQQEIERLDGLIEKAFNIDYYVDGDIEAAWEKFKAENNL